MRYGVTLLALCTVCGGLVNAEPIIVDNSNNSVSLSIYNQNIALVKDIRPTKLNSGLNEVIFDGVAKEIQPETAVIYGDGIKVSEQNYSYNLMSYYNFVKDFIGKDVNTIRVNPKNGDNIYEKAALIGVDNNNKPILRFSYGIDPNFEGRVVFNGVPDGISNKPTLAAKLHTSNSGNKNLYLAYLTGGLSWKTDYIANVVNKNKLNLTGLVTINNVSGVDYDNAKIQLIAGDVNVARNNAGLRTMAMAKFAAAEATYDNVVAAPESISSFELYTLPNITSIKNNQTKQISLLERKDVTFKKEFNLNNPLYLGAESEFEKIHPTITYVIKNTTDTNLGISLPAGVMRFYENDKNGNMQFIGSAHIAHTAKEDILKLHLGEAFNISASGKVKKIKEHELERSRNGRCFKVKKVKTYEVSAVINNAEDVANTVTLTQYFTNDYKIISENIKSESKNATTRVWNINIDKNSKQTLEYVVEITSDDNEC